MLNTIVVIGRLTKDPEIRNTNSGRKVANFNVAIDNRSKNPDGTRGTTFINCVSFQDGIEETTKYLRCGNRVAVQGCLQERTFIRKDGNKGHDYEIIVDSLTFLEPKKKDEVDEMIDEELQVAKAVLDLPDDDLPFNKEETKPQEKVKPVKEPKYDPFTGKPLKSKSKK